MVYISKWETPHYSFCYFQNIYFLFPLQFVATNYPLDKAQNFFYHVLRNDFHTLTNRYASWIL
jgi:hypothetical protein